MIDFDRWHIEQADCIAYLKTLPDECIDAIVTDPPYHLTSIVKRFGKEDSAPARGNEAFARASKGFMGQTWDGGDIAMRPEVWAEAYRVLRPGGHLLSFGGTRTHHRIWCAIEDAGFDIRQTIMWCFGSGFPKSLDIGKAIDKLAGADREVIAGGIGSKTGTTYSSSGGYVAGSPTSHIAATEAAKKWDGWGSDVKPAYEPICLARKPLSESSIARNVLKHGTGGINIAGCRVGTEPTLTRIAGGKGFGANFRDDNWQPPAQSEVRVNSAGRFPPNLLLSHSPACNPVGTKRVKSSGHYPAARGQGGIGSDGNSGQDGLEERYTDGEEVEVWDCSPDCPVREMNRQSGESKSGGYPAAGGQRTQVATYGKPNTRGEPQFGANTGGAARYFPTFRYQAKPARREKEMGLDDLPDGTLNRVNSAGMERDPKWAPRIVKNLHPTVKSVSLMRWLCRLVTPPGGIVLDPFAGSGSTGCAAMAEGFRFIGVEQSAEYAAIARGRVAHWASSQHTPIDDPYEPYQGEALVDDTPADRRTAPRTRRRAGPRVQPDQLVMFPEQLEGETA